VKVLVIGNCAIDRSFRLSRLPAAGETVLADGSSDDIGGKGANQAVAAARAGAAVILCSAIGRDEDGARMKSRLCAESVRTEFVFERDGRTDQSVVLVATSGENCIVSSHEMARSIGPEAAADALATLEAGDILLMQGNLPRRTTEHCLREGRRRGTLVVLNPAPIAFPYSQLWELVDIVVANEVESRTLTGDGDPIAGARTLLGRGPKLVVTTLGRMGAVVVGNNRDYRIPAPQVGVVDTTGAGDVFCGVFAAGMALDLPAERAVSWAVRAATLSVTRWGTQRAFPTPGEMASLRQSNTEGELWPIQGGAGPESGGRALGAPPASDPEGHIR